MSNGIVEPKDPIMEVIGDMNRIRLDIDNNMKKVERLFHTIRSSTVSDILWNCMSNYASLKYSRLNAYYACLGDYVDVLRNVRLGILQINDVEYADNIRLKYRSIIQNLQKPEIKKIRFDKAPSELYISIDDIMSMGHQFLQISCDIQYEVGRIEKNVHCIAGQWNSDTQKVFSESFFKMKPYFKEVVKLLADVGTYLKKLGCFGEEFIP